VAARVLRRGTGQVWARGGFYFLPLFTLTLYNLPSFSLTSIICHSLLCNYIICPLSDWAHTQLQKYPSFPFFVNRTRAHVWLYLIREEQRAAARPASSKVNQRRRTLTVAGGVAASGGGAAASGPPHVLRGDLDLAIQGLQPSTTNWLVAAPRSCSIWPSSLLLLSSISIWLDDELAVSIWRMGSSEWGMCGAERQAAGVGIRRQQLATEVQRRAAAPATARVLPCSF
jgi:hypothetical protein